ncbi:MAG: hypothetical protein M1833_005421 [Piccolia ochrophora]|nr:MAG: hypothetical protein M1833_005421 [Piccolia ochrophora]
MGFASVTSMVLSYLILYPLLFLADCLRICLAPASHLAHHILQATLYPLRLLAKFETLYIYLGVAVLVGTATGALLHFCSAVLITLLDLRSNPQSQGHTAATFRAARMKKQALGLRREQDKTGRNLSVLDDTLKKDYATWLENDRAKNRASLISQTILEEEDDTDDF